MPEKFRKMSENPFFAEPQKIWKKMKNTKIMHFLKNCSFQKIKKKLNNWKVKKFYLGLKIEII